MVPNSVDFSFFSHRHCACHDRSAQQLNQHHSTEQLKTYSAADSFSSTQLDSTHVLRRSLFAIYVTDIINQTLCMSFENLCRLSQSAEHCSMQNSPEQYTVSVMHLLAYCGDHVQLQHHNMSSILTNRIGTQAMCTVCHALACLLLRPCPTRKP